VRCTSNRVISSITQAKKSKVCVLTLGLLSHNVKARFKGDRSFHFSRHQMIIPILRRDSAMPGTGVHSSDYAACPVHCSTQEAVSHAAGEVCVLNLSKPESTKVASPLFYSNGKRYCQSRAARASCPKRRYVWKLKGVLI